VAAAVEVLDADSRESRRALVFCACLVAALVGAGALIATRPPAPLSITLERVDGSALQEDTFVRLNVRLRAADSDDLRLREVRLQLAGVESLGQHEARFDGRGRAEVQIDLRPGCDTITDTPQGLPVGSLDVAVGDGSGAIRRLSLPISPEGSLERLVRYRCT